MTEPSGSAEPRSTSRAWLAPLAQLVGLCVAVGAVAGVVWELVAPTPAFVIRDGNLGYVKDLPGEYIAMDGWFAVIAVVAGGLVATVVLLRGPVGPWRVVAVPVAGLLGSWVAFRLGVALGPDLPVQPTANAASGTVIHGKLDLHANGVLLIWSVVSLVILTFALAFTSREDHPKPHADAQQDGALVGGDPDLRDVDRG